MVDEHTSIGVDNFFLQILSYFCLLVTACKPCHGRLEEFKNQVVKACIVGKHLQLMLIFLLNQDSS